MALLRAITYNNVPLPDTVSRVVFPQINLDEKSMNFRVWVYSTQAAYSMVDSPVLDDITEIYAEAPYDKTGANPFIQAYAYLQTLPDYAAATVVD